MLPPSFYDPALWVPVAVAVLLLGAVAIAGIRMNRTETVRKRLASVITQPGGPALTAKEQDARSTARDSKVEKRLRTAEKERAAPESKRTLRSRFAEAGWTLSSRAWWISSIMAGVVLAVIAAGLRFSPVVIVLCFIAGLLGLPRLVLAIAAAKRRKAFMDDLADAIETMVRALRAGLPVSEAMGMIARDFTGPVGAEFLLAVDEQKLGATLGESLGHIADRMPLPEMRMLAIAVNIQTQTGGSLSEALNNLANVIRARYRLKRKIKAVSSEARISAIIMGALPLFVMGALYLINGDYLSLLFTERVGKIMVGACACWMSIGVFVMWRMVNFKI